MKGMVYAVGVGPGDPELMTLKAVRLIRESTVIAVPGECVTESAAYRIAAKAVEEMEKKKVISLRMPMIKDKEALDRIHKESAKRIEAYLDRGENVVYLTLGDPTIYSTFHYLQKHLEADGYSALLVSGVPSFCAVAARRNTSLAIGDEALHIIPAVHKTLEPLPQDGACILMKTAGHMKEAKERLKESGMRAYAVENCGMESEKVYGSIDEIPDDAGYFTVVIAGKPSAGKDFIGKI